MTTTGLPFRPSYYLLKNCTSTVSSGRIIVECTYPSDSTATGFQVIAQLSSFSEVNRLYVNKTTDRQTPVSVLVEENGLYQVTVFAIRGGRGIVGTNVEYMEMVMVGDVVPTTTAISTLGRLIACSLVRFSC